MRTLALYSTYISTELTGVNRVSVSPTNGIGPTQGQRKTLTRVGSRGFISHSGQSVSLSLCGPNSISRANAHMVYMGRI